jgi:DNA-binding NtrC family response regulator
MAYRSFSAEDTIRIAPFTGRENFHESVGSGRFRENLDFRLAVLVVALRALNLHA